MPWLVAFLEGMLSRSWLILYGFVAFLLAKRVVLVSAYIVAAGILFVTMAGAVKVSIELIRVSMPDSLAVGTFLLPPSINSFVATLATIRLTYFLWTWTHRNLATYAAAAASPAV